MYLSSDILKNDKYPKWIKDHQIFKDIHSFGKVFPKIGLRNETGPLVDFLAERMLEVFISDLLNLKIDHFIVNNEIYELFKDDSITQAIYSFFTKFKTKDYLVIKKCNKISIYIPEDITSNNGKIIFNKGSSLFSLLEMGCKRKIIPDVFALDSFKKFSRLNIPLSSAEICFSTEPWEIATMSMRGIKTCQSWDGEYRHCVIGSMLDPYVGIIYLRSKNKDTDYGSKMLFRGIVRFAIKNKDKQKKGTPVLIIDHIYPEFSPDILNVFKTYLEEKSKIKVLYAPDIEDDIIKGFYFLPKNKIKDTFQFYSEDGKYDKPVRHDHSIEPYQNIRIKYNTNNSNLELNKKRKEIIRSNFINLIIKNISTSAIELGSFSSEKINILLAIKNKRLAFKDQVLNSVRAFSNHLMRYLDSDFNLDDRSYQIKLYLNYFNKKKHILESISNQVSQWNGAFSLRKSTALSKKDFVLVMQQIMQKADQALKAELKTFLARSH